MYLPNSWTCVLKIPINGKTNLTIIKCINVGEFLRYFFRRDVGKLSGAIILHHIFNGNPTQNWPEDKGTASPKKKGGLSLKFNHGQY